MTDTPWTVVRVTESGLYDIHDSQGNLVACMVGDDRNVPKYAERIVAAVNGVATTQKPPSLKAMRILKTLTVSPPRSRH